MSSRHILIVEDSDADFIALKRAFRINQIQNSYSHVNTGDAALEYLCIIKSNGHSQGNVLPGLILLDLNLPGFDGREILRQIKNDQRCKDIPIIIFSTSGSAKDKAACQEQGANDYLQKPIDYASFVQTIKYLKESWL